MPGLVGHEAAHHDGPTGTVERLDDARVLMYSHDTFGLGHLRRCRAIAHALVERFKGLHVLIVSGSPIAGAFEFRTRVDFVKIPSVIKLYNGEYTSLAEHTDLDETLSLRRSIIQSTAENFRPDVFIVDKEPLGLRGELEPTLTYLKTQGTTLVLGLREVMDAPDFLAAEWARSDVVRKMDRFYDSVWVYGPPDFYDPMTGLDLPASLAARVTYTGWLRRDVPSGPFFTGPTMGQNGLLVTAGGGGDGARIMRQVIAAHEHDPVRDATTTLVLGPFMKAEDREEIHRRVAAHPALSLIDFDTRLEALMRDATGVVSMGGYNTFCEVLSLDKRALVIPRVRPREEQLIRARRAAELGLVDMLMPDAADDPAAMSAALKRLAVRPTPSQTRYGAPLEGLARICALIHDTMARRGRPNLTVLAGGRQDV